MKYEIPKEIKSKPKIAGMEIRELVILLISSLLILTVFRELVHSIFIIPYFVISGVFLIFLVMPSRNNPQLKNYMSLYLLYKHNRQTYHALDHQKPLNNLLYERDES